MEANTLPEIQALEEALICSICHELLNAPVMLSCGHTYCSTCIRSNVAYCIQYHNTPQCPDCRGNVDPNALRAVVALRDAVPRFIALKTAVEKLLQQQQQQAQASRSGALRSSKRKHRPASAPEEGSNAPHLPSTLTSNAAPVEDDVVGDDACAGPSATHSARRSSRQRSKPGALAPSGPHPDEADAALEQDVGADGSECSDEQSGSEVDNGSDVDEEDDDDDDDDDDDFVEDEEEEGGRSRGRPPKRQRLVNRGRGTTSNQGTPPTPSGPVTPAGFVACPICTMTVPETVINTHIDACLTKQQAGPATVPPMRSRTKASRAAASAGPPTAGPYQPVAQLPPKYLFTLMKDKELKNKLAAHNLPTTGTREELIQRYQRFRRYVQTHIDGGGSLSTQQLLPRFLSDEHRAAQARNTAPKVNMPLTATTFSELVATTRERDAKRRATEPETMAAPS